MKCVYPRPRIWTTNSASEDASVYVLCPVRNKACLVPTSMFSTYQYFNRNGSHFYHFDSDTKAATFCSETSSRASILYRAALSLSHCSIENSPSMIPARHLAVTSSTHEGKGANLRLDMPVARRMRSLELNSDHLCSIKRGTCQHSRFDPFCWQLRKCKMPRCKMPRCR